MTELGWIPPMSSGPSLGLLKAFLPARLNPQCLLSTSQPFLMTLLALHLPKLLSRRSHYYLKINAFLSSSFTKNIPSSSPFPQLLAQASAFERSLGLTGSMLLRLCYGAHSHPAGHPRLSNPYHRTKLVILWSYSFWRMVLSPFASDRINLLAVR